MPLPLIPIALGFIIGAAVGSVGATAYYVSNHEDSPEGDEEVVEDGSDGSPDD